MSGLSSRFYFIGLGTYTGPTFTHWFRFKRFWKDRFCEEPYRQTWSVALLWVCLAFALSTEEWEELCLAFRLDPGMCFKCVYHIECDNVTERQRWKSYVSNHTGYTLLYLQQRVIQASVVCFTFHRTWDFLRKWETTRTQHTSIAQLDNNVNITVSKSRYRSKRLCRDFVDILDSSIFTQWFAVVNMTESRNQRGYH